MSGLTTTETSPWRAGLRSARANLLPGLVLQAFALAAVFGYYFYPATRAVCDQLSDLRNKTGVFFSIVSTGLCGGLIPLLYLKSVSATRAQMTWRQGMALTGFWSYKGVEVGLWYGFMAWSIGESSNLSIVATKTALDQFIYCPLWAVPETALFYFWCQTSFNTRAVVDDLRAPRWYARRILPMLCANFGVWLPLVCIIYALPTPLQLPLQNIVLCFFTLMLAHMTHSGDSNR